MVVHFITTQDGIITGQHAGDIAADFSNTPYHEHERVVIPKGVLVANGDKVEFYDSNWTRKSAIQLIDDGIIPMPEGYVREDDQLRPMTEVELIRAGLAELPQRYLIDGDEVRPMTELELFEAGFIERPGYKVVDGKLVPMTAQEQLNAGQITQTEYEQRIAALNEDELNRRLAELQTPVALARAEVDTEFAASRREKLAALLAVTEQPGWPLKVEWPESI